MACRGSAQKQTAWMALSSTLLGWLLRYQQDHPLSPASVPIPSHGWDLCRVHVHTHIPHLHTHACIHANTRTRHTCTRVFTMHTTHMRMHTFSHTNTCMCIQAHTSSHIIHTYTHSHEHAHMCTHHIHTLTYKHPCTYMLTMTHTCAHTCTHSHTYTYTHTTQCTYVCTHTHTTHACTSTQACTRGSQCGAGGDSAWPPPWRCHLVAAEAGSNQRQWEGSGGRSLFADYYW